MLARCCRACRGGRSASCTQVAGTPSCRCAAARASGLGCPQAERALRTWRGRQGMLPMSGLQTRCASPTRPRTGTLCCSQAGRAAGPAGYAAGVRVAGDPAPLPRARAQGRARGGGRLARGGRRRRRRQLPPAPHGHVPGAHARPGLVPRDVRCAPAPPAGDGGTRAPRCAASRKGARDVPAPATALTTGIGYGNLCIPYPTPVRTRRLEHHAHDGPA